MAKQAKAKQGKQVAFSCRHGHSIELDNPDAYVDPQFAGFTFVIATKGIVDLARRALKMKTACKPCNREHARAEKDRPWEKGKAGLETYVKRLEAETQARLSKEKEVTRGKA